MEKPGGFFEGGVAGLFDVAAERLDGLLAAAPFVEEAGELDGWGGLFAGKLLPLCRLAEESLDEFVEVVAAG